MTPRSHFGRLSWRRAALAAALTAWSTDSAAHAIAIPGWVAGLFLIGFCGVLACFVVPLFREESSIARRLLAGVGFAFLDLAAWIALFFMVQAVPRALPDDETLAMSFLMLFPWILPIGLFFWGRRAL